MFIIGKNIFHTSSSSELLIRLLCSYFLLRAYKHGYGEYLFCFIVSSYALLYYYTTYYELYCSPNCLSEATYAVTQKSYQEPFLDALAGILNTLFMIPFMRGVRLGLLISVLFRWYTYLLP